jgi:hypothetical protein
VGTAAAHVASPRTELLIFHETIQPLEIFPTMETPIGCDGWEILLADITGEIDVKYY